MKKFIIKVGAILMVIALTMFNLQFEGLPYSSIDDDVSVSLTVNKANAWYEPDLRMKKVTCWNTGQPIDKCVTDPEYLCIIAYQDPC